MSYDLLCLYCCQAETRAEFAERTVAKLEKSIDDLEGMSATHIFKCDTVNVQSSQYHDIYFANLKKQ